MLALSLQEGGQPEPRTVQALLQPDYGTEPLARFCGAEAHRIERMHFSVSRPLILQYQVWLPGGEEQRVLAQWVGKEAVSFAKSESDRLRKSRCGDLLKSDKRALLGDTTSGLVLRRPGLDSRLPGLRLLHSPRIGRDSFALEAAPTSLSISLRGHRLGKRAVLQVDRLGADQRRVFVKLRPTSSNSGRRAFDRHIALFERLGSSLALPKPLGFDAVLGASVFSALPGSPPHFAGGQADLIAGALHRLQAVTELRADRYSAVDELMLLRAWCERISTVFPDRTELFSRALGRVRRELLGLPETKPVPCHRDLHEGQILIEGDRIGFLDIDTLRLSDPALDPGNLIAHLRLAEIRSGKIGSGAIAVFTNAMRPLAAGRISAWTRAALLRLAAIYSFTSEPQETLQHLLEDVVGDQCPGGLRKQARS